MNFCRILVFKEMHCILSIVYIRLKYGSRVAAVLVLSAGEKWETASLAASAGCMVCFVAIPFLLVKVQPQGNFLDGLNEAM